MNYLIKSLFILSLFLNGSYLHAQSTAKTADSIEINSNFMEMMDEKKLIIFTGDVVAKRGDMTLYSSKLDVYYIENPDTAKKDVDYMVAVGNVKIIQLDRTAVGDIAKYFKKEDMIILEGKPAMIKEKSENQITGNKVTFYIKENKSLVEGNRPRIIFKTGE